MDQTESIPPLLSDQPPAEQLERRRRRGSCCWLAVLGLSVLAGIVGHYALIVLEGGILDDGPFYARAFSGPLPSKPDQEIKYRTGYLRVYNHVAQSPVMAFTDESRNLLHVQRLDVTTHHDFTNSTLTSITLHGVYPGLVRDAVEITSEWTFGTERGVVYLWRSGKIHRFYLSW